MIEAKNPSRSAALIAATTARTGGSDIASMSGITSLLRRNVASCRCGRAGDRACGAAAPHTLEADMTSGNTIILWVYTYRRQLLVIPGGATAVSRPIEGVH
ncbi:hypothetical protein GCM10027521_36750 [Amycolatopsis cihanbeyliensis]